MDTSKDYYESVMRDFQSYAIGRDLRNTASGSQPTETELHLK